MVLLSWIVAGWLAVCIGSIAIMAIIVRQIPLMDDEYDSSCSIGYPTRQRTFSMDKNKLARLKDISLKANSLHDQLDALAAECCEILEVPNAIDNYQGDLARSIVSERVDVYQVVSRLLIEKANEEFDEASELSQEGEPWS